MGHAVAERLIPWLALMALVTSPLMTVAWFVLCMGLWS